MSTRPPITASRLLISLLAVSNSVSPYMADFNQSHVYNPKWPPHARFHNGQTMSMGAILGLTTLYFAWRSTTKVSAGESMFSAALVGSIYWVTGLSAIFYPGTKWLDPEFVGTGYDAKLLGLPGQSMIFAAHVVLCWVAYALEARRLGKAKEV